RGGRRRRPSGHGPAPRGRARRRGRSVARGSPSGVSWRRRKPLRRRDKFAQRSASSGRRSYRNAESVKGRRATEPDRSRIELNSKEFALTGTGQPTADSASLVELYGTHGERMKSIAMNLLGNANDAEDAVQEAFLKIHRGAGRFRGGSALSTWAYRILVNVCYDMMRRGRRRPEAPLPADTALPRSADADVTLRMAIERALTRLDERERTAFLLCEV